RATGNVPSAGRACREAARRPSIVRPAGPTGPRSCAPDARHAPPESQSGLRFARLASAPWLGSSFVSAAGAPFPCASGAGIGGASGDDAGQVGRKQQDWPSRQRRGGAGRVLNFPQWVVMSELAIELKGIDKSFGLVHANRDINLKVRKGTIHGIIGENGAGKSTLMSIL